MRYRAFNVIIQQDFETHFKMLKNRNSSNEIKRIVILGHTGFIGRHLENFFKNKENIELIGNDLPSVDLTKDSDVISLKDIFDMQTGIIMCSAIKRDYGDNLDNFLKNIFMIINVCKLLETHPVRRFVYFSSAAVYGEDIQNLNISESTEINPTSYYGMAKYASERLLHKAFESKNDNGLVIIRPPVIYGPGDKPCYGPSGFIKAALNKEAITLWGDGSEKREFIFIDDIVRIVNHLMFHNYGGILNIASSKSYTFKEIIDKIAFLTHTKIEINSRKRTKNKVDNEFNNKNLQNLFPELTFIELEEGIKKTIEYIKSKK